MITPGEIRVAMMDLPPATKHGPTRAAVMIPPNDTMFARSHKQVEFEKVQRGDKYEWVVVK